MNMSFIRAKSRPKNMNLKKTNKIRSVFAMKNLKEVSTETPMTNVDDPH